MSRFPLSLSAFFSYSVLSFFFSYSVLSFFFPSIFLPISVQHFGPAFPGKVTCLCDPPPRHGQRDLLFLTWWTVWHNWDLRASWGRPHVTHEFAWWQPPGVGFTPIARPLWVIRGLGVFVFLKLSFPSICEFADVNCSVFTLRLCDGNFSTCVSNTMYFYSQCLRLELVIPSPMLISLTA